jgi:hypothetical protein
MRREDGFLRRLAGVEPAIHGTPRVGMDHRVKPGGDEVRDDDRTNFGSEGISRWRSVAPNKNGAVCSGSPARRMTKRYCAKRRSAIRQLYIESLPLWRVCPRGFCRRPQCCLNKNRSCLQRGWPLFPESVQAKAYALVNKGGPRRVPPATHLEWAPRRYPPTNFVL